MAGRSLEKSAAEHWQIIAALDEGDAEAARALLAAHRGRAAREMLALLP